MGRKKPSKRKRPRRPSSSSEQVPRQPHPFDEYFTSETRSQRAWYQASTSPPAIAHGFALGLMDEEREWWEEADLVDQVFSGLYRGFAPTDRGTFAAAREVWLDALRGSDGWQDLQALLTRQLEFIEHYRYPPHEGAWRMAVVVNAVCEGIATRPLAKELLPEAVLAVGHRVWAVPDSVVPLPEAALEHHAAARSLFADPLAAPAAPGSPTDALAQGLALLDSREHRLPHPDLLPTALFTGCAVLPGTAPLSDRLSDDARVWARALPTASPLAGLADALAVTCRHHDALESLARFLADDRAHRPLPSADTCWRTRIGDAALRESLPLPAGLQARLHSRAFVGADPVMQELFHLACRRRSQLLQAYPTAADLPGPDEEPAWWHLLDAIAHQKVAPATVHAIRATRRLPPGPSGFPEGSRKTAWDQALAAYWADHPSERARYRAQKENEDSYGWALPIALAQASIDPGYAAQLLEEMHEDYFGFPPKDERDLRGGDLPFLLGFFAPVATAALLERPDFLDLARATAARIGGAELEEAIANGVRLLQHHPTDQRIDPLRTLSAVYVLTLTGLSCQPLPQYS